MGIGTEYLNIQEEQKNNQIINEVLGGVAQDSQEIQTDAQPPKTSYRDVNDLYDKFVTSVEPDKNFYESQVKSFQTRQKVNAAANAIKILAQGVASGAFGGKGGMLVNKDQPDRWTPYLSNEIEKQKELLNQEQRNALLAKRQDEINKFNIYTKQQDKSDERFYKQKDTEAANEFALGRFDAEKTFRTNLQEDQQAADLELAKTRGGMDLEQVKERGRQDRITDTIKTANKESLLDAAYDNTVGKFGGKWDDPYMDLQGADTSTYRVSVNDMNLMADKVTNDRKYRDNQLVNLALEKPTDPKSIKILASIYAEDNFDVVGGKLVPKGKEVIPNPYQAGWAVQGEKSTPSKKTTGSIYLDLNP